MANCSGECDGIYIYLKRLNKLTITSVYITAKKPVLDLAALFLLKMGTYKTLKPGRRFAKMLCFALLRFV